MMPVGHLTAFGPRAAGYREGPPSASTTLAVAVVADSERFVPRVRAILEREGMAATVQYGGSGRLVLDGLRRRPDIVLLADSATASSAAEGQRIKRRLAAHIVVVLPPGADRDAARLIAGGIDGVVPAGDMDRMLAVVVRAVCCGLVSVPSDLRHSIQPPAFSYRERQVLALVVAGLTNEEIAAHLYVAPSTVKHHLTSAFRRLGARSRRDAVAQILTGDESLRRSVLTAAPPSEHHEPSQAR
jgi:DNA-binding NarL/FixJ family response regulator